jgi:plasmid replication initiation protein
MAVSEFNDKKYREVLVDIENKNLIVKSNRLVEAGYKLTLQEQRVILFCIAKVNSKERLENKTFCITAADYAKTYGIKLNNAYKELKDVIDTLYNRSIKLFNKEKNIEAEIRWIQDKFYFNNEGYAKITLSAGVAPLLSELKSHFTSYHLEYIAGMKSIYAIRLYELFKQFGIIGKREVELEWLKKRLHIGEIYSAFADLKRRVVDPALKEINKHSDLNVNYKLVKHIRKVVGLEFTFCKKNPVAEQQMENNDSNVEIVNSVLLGELKSFGISEKQALSILSKYDDEKVQYAIDLTQINIKNNQLKKSISGFLIKAITEGYTSYEVVKRQKEKLNAAHHQKINEKKEMLNKLIKEYEEFIYNYIDSKIKEFSCDKKQEYLDRFLKASNVYTVKNYKKYGLEYGRLYSMFIDFMKKQIEIPTSGQFFMEKKIDISEIQKELTSLQQIST